MHHSVTFFHDDEYALCTRQFGYFQISTTPPTQPIDDQMCHTFAVLALIPAMLLEKSYRSKLARIAH